MGISVFAADSGAPSPARGTPEQRAALRWYEENLKGTYHRAGTRDGRWDSPVESALLMVSEGLAEIPTADPRWRELVAELTDSALREGCSDPLVRYLSRRYRVQPTRSARKSAEGAAEWVALSTDMAASRYAPHFKFFVELETASALRSAMPAGTNTWPDIHRHRHAAMDYLVSALADKSTPRAELTEMVTAERNLLRSNPQQLTLAWGQIEPLLRKNWPKLPLADLIDGQVAVDAAWKARGSGTIDTVTESGYRKFTEELQKADRLFTRAWEQDKTDPTAPTKMLTVCLGLEKDGGEMEKWFQRAMEAHPGHLPALKAKLNFLTPRWGGSVNALHAFGRECLKQESWGNQAPWLLVLAHEEIAKTLADSTTQESYQAGWQAYWRRPGVWAEVREVIDTMKQRDPAADAEIRYLLATQSRRCGMWEEFVAVAPTLDPAFQKRLAGKESFDRVLAAARARISAPAKP